MDGRAAGGRASLIALQVVVSGLHDSGYVVVVWVDGRAVMRMGERLTGDPTATTPNTLCPLPFWYESAIVSARPALEDSSLLNSAPLPTERTRPVQSGASFAPAD